MPAATLRELYGDPQVRTDFEYTWNTAIPSESVLAALDDMTEQTDIPAYLDDLFEQKPELKSDATRAICHMSPQTIMYQYGESLLVWAALNAPNSDNRQGILAGLERLAGYNLRLFERSRLWVWCNYSQTSHSEVMAQYALGDTLLNGGLEAIDLSSLLQTSLKPDAVLSSEHMQDYRLIPVTVETSCPRGYILDPVKAPDNPVRYDEIYLDAPIGFVLLYKGRPNAVAALAFSKQGELTMYQLQGVRGKKVNPRCTAGSESIVGSWGLPPLDWQRLMVAVADRFAYQNGFEVLGIQEGKQNYWANRSLHGDVGPHLPKNVAKKAYDMPARRLGFKRGVDKNWYRPVRDNIVR